MKRLRVILCLLLLIVLAGVFVLWRRGSIELRYYPEMIVAAERYQVDPSLVRAIVWRESRFKPNVRGAAGELGLMQIQEIAAQEWADAERNEAFQHTHCLNPGTNVLAATFYFAKLMKRYRHTDNPVPYALADYNAGRGNVIRWNKGEASTNSAAFIEAIGFPSTKHYVKSVLRRYRLYQTLNQVGL